jgi:hypothetical protein
MAYLLHFNQIGGLWPRWWLAVADLPLALVACLYGGLSLYRSVFGNKLSIPGSILIGLPLLVFFVFLVFLNYWNAFNLTDLLGLSS